ncbi:MAG: hypothetical protein AAF489_07000 [Bacteroidota bacterium]
MKSILLCLCLGVSLMTFSQSFEVGPMLNLERTTFTVPTGDIVIIVGGTGGGEDTRNTGYESNIAFGGYFSYYPDGGFSDRLALSTELFYNETSSTEFGDLSFSTISLIPYVSFSFFDDFPLFMGIGGGIAFVLDKPSFPQESFNDDIQNIDIPLKMMLAYRFEDIVTIELGVHGSVTKVVKDEVARNSYYLGVKVPLNQLLKK